MPIDFGSGSTSGIMGIAYNRLKNHLAIDPGPTRIFSEMMQLAVPDMELVERLHGDIVTNDYRFDVTGWRAWDLPDGTPARVPENWNLHRRGDGWVILDGDRVVYRMPAGCLYFEWGDPIFADATPADIDRWEMPLLTDEQLDYLSRMSRELYDGTDYCVKTTLMGSVYEAGYAVRGMGQFLMDLMLDRPLAEAIMNKFCEGHMRNFDLFHEAVQGRCDVIWIGDDLGTQKSPQISPDLYHEVIWPFHCRQYQHYKSKGDYRLVLHSCGSIMPLIEDLIEAGIDGLNPVQFTAENMDPRELKERFGDRIVFWGGGVSNLVLQNGTPEEVAAEVKEMCEIFKPGGGFVWNPIHNIQATVPPENIVAAYEAAWDAAPY